MLLLSCPNWDIEIYKNIRLQIEDYKEMNITYFPFMKKMSAMYNISLESMNFSKLSSLFDTLTVDKFLGRPLPSDMLDSDYTNLQHLHEWFNAFKISQNLSKALNSVKFQKVLSEFDSRIRNPDTYPRRWTFLSAHDTDIAAAHVDLNISSAHCIEDLYRKGSTSAINCEQSTEYASSIIFELHSDN